jgi:hypothetical protein
MLPRAVDMLAVAVQLPAAVVTDACCDAIDRAASPSVPEPEASAGTASARTAQVADATDLMRMAKPLPATMNDTRIRRETLRPAYKTLNDGRSLLAGPIAIEDGALMEPSGQPGPCRPGAVGGLNGLPEMRRGSSL